MTDDEREVQRLAKIFRTFPPYLQKAVLAFLTSLKETDTPTLPPHFQCPKCGRISFNPHDIAEGYCGACHIWVH
jgi:hypothetical protein